MVKLVNTIIALKNVCKAANWPAVLTKNNMCFTMCDLTRQRQFALCKISENNNLTI